MGLELTIISAISLVLVAAISTAGTIYAARLNRKVDTVKEATHHVVSQLETKNGDTIAQKVEQLADQEKDK